MKILYIDAEFDDGRKAVKDCAEARKDWIEDLGHTVDISGNLSILENLSHSEIAEYDEIIINLGVKGERSDLLAGVKQLKREHPGHISIGDQLPTDITFVSGDPMNGWDAFNHAGKFALLQDYGQAASGSLNDLRLEKISRGKPPASLLAAPQLAGVPG